jgi:hypothetical protein
MSLNQKYTWADFLKEYPEHKEKNTKRTSSEGKKAFEAAYKKFIKTYLDERGAQLKKLEAKTVAQRDDFVKQVQSFQKKKDFAKATFYQKKAGLKESAIAELKRQADRTKAVAKKF